MIVHEDTEQCPCCGDFLREGHACDAPTPAWNYQRTAGDHDFLIYDDQRTVCLVYGNNEKTARIVAQAPALLTQCKMILEDIEAKLSGDLIDTEKGLKATRRELETMIALAEMPDEERA